MENALPGALNSGKCHWGKTDRKRTIRGPLYNRTLHILQERGFANTTFGVYSKLSKSLTRFTYIIAHS